MKKLLALLLAVFMLVCFAACGDDKDSTESDTSKTSSTASTNSSSNTSSETSSKESVEHITAGLNNMTIKSEPNKRFEVVFNTTDATTGVLEISQVSTTTATEMASLNLSGSLESKSIKIYNVTYTTAVDGTVTLKGELAGLKMVLVGDAANDYKTLANSMLGNSAEDKLAKKLLAGETITDAADFKVLLDNENYKIKLSYQIIDGKMIVRGFAEDSYNAHYEYSLREAYTVKDGTIRAKDRYEDGFMERRYLYRANGTLKQEIRYYTDADPSITNYDENGNVVYN
jgi:soluble P-type ATPase